MVILWWFDGNSNGKSIDYLVLCHGSHGGRVTPSHHPVVDDLFSIETTMVVWGCPMTYHLVI
jgi:hypothetical protein